MTSPIERSLELAAARCDDLTPLVYARLFRERPELKDLFRKDARFVQGEMLALALEGILDFVGPRTYAHFWFANEGVRHDANIDRQTFMLFFQCVADVLRELIGADWTPEMAAAWNQAIVEIDGYVKEGNM